MGSIVTPRYLDDCDSERGTECLVYWETIFLLLLVIRRSSHFCGWNSILLIVSHLWRESRSLCRVALSSGDLITRYRRLSSANSLRCVPCERSFAISLMYTRNSKGPNTVPCGTPERTGRGDDSEPSTMTVCSRFDKKDFSQARRELLMPYDGSLERRSL